MIALRSSFFVRSRPGITYVNRVLAFIFATDESFDQLMRLPKEPFKMSCSDQLCVNLAHISLQVDSLDCPTATAGGGGGAAMNINTAQNQQPGQ